MTSKIITALIAVLLVAAGCGPAANMTHPRQVAPASNPKKCTPGYRPCLPPRADYDCSDIKGRFYVDGKDPYFLDKDYDGVGCDVDDQ